MIQIYGGPAFKIFCLNSISHLVIGTVSEQSPPSSTRYRIESTDPMMLKFGLDIDLGLIHKYNDNNSLKLRLFAIFL